MNLEVDRLWAYKWRRHLLSESSDHLLSGNWPDAAHALPYSVCLIAFVQAVEYLIIR